MASLLSARAMSTMFTITVLIPLPFPSTFLWFLAYRYAFYGSLRRRREAHANIKSAKNHPLATIAGIL